jgi:hypothetical protein
MTDSIVSGNTWSVGRNVVVFSILVLLGSLSLENFPGLWSDEGWTLCVARTWVERSYYGCLLNGEPASAAWAAHPPIVVSIALSFKLFGVGIWQGRIVGIGFTLGAFWLLWSLTEKIYDRRHAWAALTLALLLPLRWQLHPWLLGRQVVGEMPMLFYLLAGYLCFFLTLQKSWLFFFAAQALWGIALMSKMQVEPFWAVSLVIPLIITLVQRQWRFSIFLTLGLLGSTGALQLLRIGRRLFLPQASPSPPLHNDLIHQQALVFIPSIRLQTLLLTFTLGLPTVIGLMYTARKILRSQLVTDPLRHQDLLQLMLFLLTSSWLAWYSLLSIGWERYAAPALFLASPFVATLLHSLTDGFHFSHTLGLARAAVLQRNFSGPNLRALSALLLVGVMIGASAISLTYKFFSEYDASPRQVANFLNTATPPHSRIELFDSPLFFLLDRPYHYPLPPVRVALGRRRFLGKETTVLYDPLEADPDYLVLGPTGRNMHLYDSVLAASTFRWLRTIGSYDIYERVREQQK